MKTVADDPGHTFVENVDGGYRLWCSVCGEEEYVPIAETGMPVEALVAWIKVFDKHHANCGGQSED